MAPVGTSRLPSPQLEGAAGVAAAAAGAGVDPTENAGTCAAGAGAGVDPNIGAGAGAGVSAVEDFPKEKGAGAPADGASLDGFDPNDMVG